MARRARIGSARPDLARVLLVPHPPRVGAQYRPEEPALPLRHELVILRVAGIPRQSQAGKRADDIRRHLLVALPQLAVELADIDHADGDKGGDRPQHQPGALANGPLALEQRYTISCMMPRQIHSMPT
jgi:hypothetical protein